MRTQDRAMSNLESMPGGFNLLSRMHRDISEPLNDAFNDTGNSGPSSAAATAAAATEAAETNPFIALLAPPQGPNNEALPNPWAAPTPTPPPAVGAGTSPFASLFGGAGPAANGPTVRSSQTAAATPTSEAASGHPGSFGMSGMPGGQNPEQVLQMLENPMMRQMMEQMMSNPGQSLSDHVTDVSESLKIRPKVTHYPLHPPHQM